jgi:hypothetical protein
MNSRITALLCPAVVFLWPLVAGGQTASRPARAPVTQRPSAVPVQAGTAEPQTAAARRGLDPLAATGNSPWTSDKAAHLLRRAGFGGTPEQVRQLTRLGRDRAVSLLVDYEATPQDDADYPEDTFITMPRGLMADVDPEARRELNQIIMRLGRAHAAAIQDWWLRRMVATPRPLEEKMTLFWHGHFTSGIREVRQARLMYQQNQFLRVNAMGNFRELVKGISRDPAMLIYLDNGRNVKQQPNENYARELLELFTMGEGHYTEQDVKEAARAFTGWTAGEQGFLVRYRLHDDGVKSFLGRTGRFDGDDIIDIIFEQPATARHLARKLWTFFVEPEPDDMIIDALAERIRAADYDIRETMRTILRSDTFYHPRTRGSLIKSPAELLVQTARSLEMPIADLRTANQQMQQMGQELFQPPNVKGWDGGRAWINTSTLFIRYNTMAGSIYGSQRSGRDRGFEQYVARLAAIGIGRGMEDAAVEEEETRPGAQARGERQRSGIAARTGRGRVDTGDDGGMTAGAMMPGPVAMAADEEMDALATAVARLPEPARDWLRDLPLPPQFSGPQPPYDPMPVIEEHRLTTPQAIVDHYAARLLPVPLSSERKQVLVRALELSVAAEAGAARNAARPRQAGASRAATAQPDFAGMVRGMIHLIVSMPEYQLN